jgi:hypothetical protein
MPELKNSFLAGIMNKDLDERLVPDGVYRDALNVDIDTADGGNIGAVKNKKGNLLVSNVWNVAGFPYPLAADAKTIGAVANERDGFIYWFVTSDKFDGIYEYDTTIGTTVRVLQSNKLTPSTKSKLNFNKEFLITGVNFIDGFLYWTDNLNPPRRINIARVKSNSLGTSGYSIDDPRIDEDINVILAPPLNAPKISLVNNTSTQSNNMEEKFLYFSYRYKYVDDQYSALSPFSAVAFKPKDYQLDFRAGNNKSMVNRFNEVGITVFTGNQFVKEVQVIMRDARSINCLIVETIDKQELALSNDVFYSFTFNNNKTYTLLPEGQVTRLFDNVPLLAKAQDYVGNRIMYGNYTQFYDIDFPVKLDVKYVSIDGLGNVPTQTFRSDRDYELGLIYLDKYGRSTTALTSQGNTTYIPPTQSDKGNSLKLRISNNPPSWATNYRVIIKQSRDQYYNIFPIDARVGGSYRYFLINESDREKVSTGDYLIFKSTPGGPTFFNKKYKILEIKDKASGFISGAFPGLYIKIKVDSPNELDLQTGITTAYFESTGTDNASANVFGGSGSSNPGVIPYPVNPLNIYEYIENPVHYGNGSSGALSVTNNNIPPVAGVVDKDYRITVEAIGNNQFRYSTDLTGAGGTVLNITLLNQILYNGGIPLCQIKWNYTPTVGDIWKINVRSQEGFFIDNYFGGKGILGPSASNSSSNVLWSNNVGGYLVLGESNANLQTINEGDIISIEVTQDLYNPSAYTTLQVFPPSPATYENIEEWFVESGEYLNFQAIDINGNSKDKQAVSFRRGNGPTLESSGTSAPSFSQIQPADLFSQGINNQLSRPVFMIIMGYGHNDAGVGNPPQANVLTGNMSIRRISNQIIAETTPKDVDIDVFHELSRTFKIENGKHRVRWKYKDSTFVSTGPHAGKTNLGQVNPSATPTSTDEMHNYVAGETVYINGGWFSGMYEILFVPNPYNIVIDLGFVAGPLSPGSVAYDLIEQDQTSTNSGAVIKINNPNSTVNSDFNAWSYTNALETFRIRDDYAAATLQYSPRVTTIIDEYQQKVSRNAISYSGVYGENTDFNALNEFNLSRANFKYLDSEFGSIQKLHARDTDLLVFQENKVSSVLYGKNLLSDSVGGGSVVSVPEVLGTQIAFPGEYGISLNPESFAVWGTDIYFTDVRRGVVMGLYGNQMDEISNTGMQDYFIELMRDYPNTQKLGCYDPHNQAYVLANNDTTILNCNVRLNRYSKNVPSNTSNLANSLFTIIGDVSWTISVVSLGSGTNWVSNYQTFGFGTTPITGIIAVNNTGSNRSIKFVVTYCGGKTLEFILTQGVGKVGNVISVVINNPIRPVPGKFSKL